LVSVLSPGTGNRTFHHHVEAALLALLSAALLSGLFHRRLRADVGTAAASDRALHDLPDHDHASRV